MKKIILLTLLCGFLSAQQTVYVDKVVDGDTFHSQQTHYRIAEIDAPELHQTYGIESKTYLSKLILHKNVQVYTIGIDKYNRQLVKVYLKEKYLPEILVKTGNAWWYEKYSSNKKLKYLQERAKSLRFGLWKYKSVEQPYKYRYNESKRNNVGR